MTASPHPPWHVDQAAYQQWIEQVEAPFRSAQPPVSGPLISIVLSTYNSAENWLRQALDSVLAQRYPNWQLCIADDASSAPGVEKILREYCAGDPRISLCLRSDNGGVAAAGNSALELATGEFIAFMDHDDCLPDHALATVALHLEAHPQSRLLYSDSDHLDERGIRCRPFFKAGPNYDLLLGQNYFNHLTVIDRSLVSELHGLREGFDGSQDYDLLLRAIELLEPSQVQHIPQVLYHWREVPGSVSRSDIAAAARAARESLRQHLERRGVEAGVKPAENALIYNQVEWPLPSPAPRLCIVTAAADSASANDTARGLASVTDYPRAKFIPCVYRREGLEGIQASASSADFELVCIVPRGFRPLRPDWARRLAALALRTHSGCVGATTLDASQEKVLDPPTVVATGPDGRKTPQSNYWGPGKGYFAGLALDREVSLLGGGVVMLRKALWQAYLDRVGGNLSLAELPAQLSLECLERGLHNRWTPFAPFVYDDQAPAPFPLDGTVNEALARWQGKDINFNPALAFCRDLSAPVQP